MVVTMAVIIGIVFGGTVGRAAGGVTVTGRTMAVGNGSPARFVGFVAENRGEDPAEVLGLDVLFAFSKRTASSGPNMTQKSALTVYRDAHSGGMRDASGVSSSCLSVRLSSIRLGWPVTSHC